MLVLKCAQGPLKGVAAQAPVSAQRQNPGGGGARFRGTSVAVVTFIVVTTRHGEYSACRLCRAQPGTDCS